MTLKKGGEGSTRGSHSGSNDKNVTNRRQAWGRMVAKTIHSASFLFFPLFQIHQGVQSTGGERNGNPLLDSCLENPRDRAARGIAVCGVTQSRIRLKQLSSSSSSQSIGSRTNVLLAIEYQK